MRESGITRLKFVLWLSLSTILLGLGAIHVRADDTKKATPGTAPPHANLSTLGWLRGSWEGAGIRGGKALEVYSEAAGGQMAGHFRQLKPDGSVMFYELMAITEKEGSLHYRLKHFNADLTGWEEQKVVRDFPLVAIEGDAWYFDGLTIKKNGPDGMTAIVRIEQKDGTSHELAFRYTRRR